MTTGQTVRLPSVDRILGDAACLALIAEYGRVQTLACARAVLAELRTAMLAGAGIGNFGEEGASLAAIAAQMAERLQAQSRSQLRAVFNLTGTVLHTNLGRAMRATAENPRVASLMGVKPDMVISATFIIGAILAAVAGIMYASNYGTAQHTMGFLPGLKAFTAAVFGGIGNLAGAVVGGILLGLIEAIGSGYIGTLTGGLLGSHYTDIFAFIVLIIILTLRPSGLLGERVADRA